MTTALFLNLLVNGGVLVSVRWLFAKSSALNKHRGPIVFVVVVVVVLLVLLVLLLLRRCSGVVVLQQQQ